MFSLSRSIVFHLQINNEQR
uniref:Uncharacterized protein n=1 Tax=Anguilla anguilla TaxID=7936 RepID=A0A0E9TYB8_ANGAN